RSNVFYPVSQERHWATEAALLTTPLDQRPAPRPMGFMTTIRSVCVYCGSSPGRSEIYMRAGEALGRSIAAHGLRLVFGGGTKGIMGAVARGALDSGGAVTGIIP